VADPVKLAMVFADGRTEGPVVIAGLVEGTKPLGIAVAVVREKVAS